MFRHIFIFALFATCIGYCLAAEMPADWAPDTESQEQQWVPQPVWPAPGSDADVRIVPAGQQAVAENDGDNIRIVSKIGSDLIVENNINLGARPAFDQGFSGGANMTHNRPAPHGFNIWEGRAEMPLMHAEMMEDDGAPVLVMSRSGRQRSTRQQQAIINTWQQESGNNWQQQQQQPVAAPEPEMDVDVDVDYEAEPPAGAPDQVRSWVVASGQTLRQVLQDWCDREGWDLVWATSREYPVQASAVFKGRFLDVASALVRNFSRANPPPHAKFYKGNRVVVVTTAGGE
jgi:type IV pili sensor histidine kinase/response regulator